MRYFVGKQRFWQCDGRQAHEDKGLGPSALISSSSIALPLSQSQAERTATIFSMLVNSIPVYLHYYIIYIFLISGQHKKREMIEPFVNQHGNICKKVNGGHVA